MEIMDDLKNSSFWIQMGHLDSDILDDIFLGVADQLDHEYHLVQKIVVMLLGYMVLSN
jgi:hypothetical protein